MEDDRLSILIVDDESYNLDLIERTLRGEYDVVRAESGEQALAVLDNLPNLALIITDQRMPGLTGTEMLRDARVQRPEAVRVILTGYSDSNELIEAINSSNVYRYLTKPLLPEQLRAVVRRALRVYRAGGGFTVDDITGLPNRVTFTRELSRELSRAQRTNSHVTIVLITVVNIEECTYLLEDAGDDQGLMATIASEVEKNIRIMDLLTSCGTGKIAVILPDCEFGNNPSERIRESVSSCQQFQTVQARHPELHIAVAAAAFPQHGATADELLRTAETGSD